jgi:hypothetical protein
MSERDKAVSKIIRISCNARILAGKSGDRGPLLNTAMQKADECAISVAPSDVPIFVELPAGLECDDFQDEPLSRSSVLVEHDLSAPRDNRSAEAVVDARSDQVDVLTDALAMVEHRAEGRVTGHAISRLRTLA